MIRISTGQIRGARDNQEDRAILAFGDKFIEAAEEGVVSLKTSNPVTAVLCDGMGGHEAGEVAARIASETFIRDALRSGAKNLKASLLSANDAIAREVRKNGARKGMGTTLVGVHVADDTLHWVSVGDSSLLLFRRGRLARLNQDHSMRTAFNRMVMQGLMSEADARKQPQRNALMSALGGDELNLIDVGVGGFALKGGDVVLLCSDGIDELPLAALQARLQSRKDSRHKLSGLMDDVTALGNEHQDNMTIAMLEII